MSSSAMRNPCAFIVRRHLTTDAARPPNRSDLDDHLIRLQSRAPDRGQEPIVLLRIEVEVCGQTFTKSAAPWGSRSASERARVPQLVEVMCRPSCSATSNAS